MNLKDILTPELYAQVQEGIEAYNKDKDDSKKAKFVDLSEGQYVGKGKYDDQTKTLNKQIKDLNDLLKQRDTDIESITKQLTEAQTDAGKLGEVQKSLSDLQSQYAKAQADWEAQTKKQAFDFALKTAVDKMKFSSVAAKRDFLRGASDAGLTLDGETIIGLTDYVEKYRKDDPDAFKAETDTGGQPKPQDGSQGSSGGSPTIPTITLPTGGSGSGKPAGVFDFHFAGVRPVKAQ